MAMIAKLAPQQITIRGQINATGWQYIPLEALSPHITISPGATRYDLPHTGMWELQISTPYGCRLSFGGETGDIEPGTSFLYRTASAGQMHVRLQHNGTSETVGSEIVMVLRPV